MDISDTEARVRVRERQQLNTEDEHVYRRLAAREHVRPEDEPSLERLRAHHLVEHDPHSPRTPLTLDPRIAERQQIQEAHARIITELANLREMRDTYRRLEDAYSSQQASEGGVRLLDTKELANAAIGRAMARLSSALYTAQPAQRSPQVLAASRERDGTLLRRGVKMYTIYPQSAQRREPEMEWVEYMSGLGAEIRTSPVPFPRIIVVDGVAAYVEEPPEDDEEPGVEEPRSAIEFTHPSAVTWVRSVYMYYWRMSQPWHGGYMREVHSASVTTPRERAVLRLLESETPRSRIARDLDVSQRTISNDLQTLRQKFGVDTDFALAMRWRAHPEYNLP